MSERRVNGKQWRPYKLFFLSCPVPRMLVVKKFSVVAYRKYTLDSEKTKRLLAFHKLSGSILFSSFPGFGDCNVPIILSNTRPLQIHQGRNAWNCLITVEN